MFRKLQVVDERWVLKPSPFHAEGTNTYCTLRRYAKRAALASVYSATELYMLTDYSAECVDTWDYLDRRLKDMVSLSESFGMQL